jgi:hypothetical protein
MSIACLPEGPQAAACMDAIFTEASWRRTPGKDGIRSGGPPRLAQRLPANQRAPEREERFADVGPLVVTDAQASELVEPGKRPLHNPSPPAQPTPVRGTTHSDPRYDMPRPQPTPNRRSVSRDRRAHSPAAAVARGLSLTSSVVRSRAHLSAENLYSTEAAGAVPRTASEAPPRR